MFYLPAKMPQNALICLFNLGSLSAKTIVSIFLSFFLSESSLQNVTQQLALIIVISYHTLPHRVQHFKCIAQLSSCCVRA